MKVLVQPIKMTGSWGYLTESRRYATSTPLFHDYLRNI